MIYSIVRAIARRIARWMGLHPDVGRLIRGGFRLTNPTSAPSPSENLAFASRVIASGMWNYCFFQFYRHFAGPYWVERQYNPQDPSFIPRAGSMLSVNMTHRDWMGFRAPDGQFFSLVDPGGAVSPIVGYYTIETAVRAGGRLYLPSRGELEIAQHPAGDIGIPVTFLRCKQGVIRWTNAAGSDLLYSLVEYDFSEPAEVIIGIRPFNQEGAALIHSLQYDPERQLVFMNDVPELKLLQKPDIVHFSTLQGGDAYFSDGGEMSAECPYGIGTGVLRYQVSGRGNISFLARTGEPKLSKEQRKSELRFLRELAPGYTEGFAGHNNPVTETIDFVSGRRRRRKRAEKIAKRRMLDAVSGPVASEIQNLSTAWKERLSHGAKFICGRELWNEAARIFASHTLSLQKGNEVTPGVFTYHKFWFRDAAYMLHALSRWNYFAESKAVLESYPSRQEKDGFFRSHDGEWDSNGQAMWSLVSYAQLSGDKAFLAAVYPSIRRGAEWILRKKKEGPGGRFLPPGFSAEHLGPADHYYWDNLWSVAGLDVAAYAAHAMGLWTDEQRYSSESAAYKADILDISHKDRELFGVITAAPGRPVDAGIIGSVSVLYPLELDLFPADQ
ncbi:MAG: hypothetical protein HY042_12885, partial [Spirochaetia bacterium]|nr:hypothetical protein [Spirochaetia bacterium]